MCLRMEASFGGISLVSVVFTLSVSNLVLVSLFMERTAITISKVQNQFITTPQVPVVADVDSKGQLVVRITLDDEESAKDRASSRNNGHCAASIPGFAASGPMSLLS